MPLNSASEFTVTPSTQRTSQDVRDKVLANPGFGLHFTDHMVVIDWSVEQGWHDARVQPYGPLTLDPASSVLHYAQEIFEGLKAYRHADGSVWGFIVAGDGDAKFHKGDILKPVSWAAPARNKARGNVISGNFRGCTWIGPAYLQ